MEKYLIIGLGNPGIEYDKTRHQIGFMVVDNFVNNYNLSYKTSSLNGEVCEFVNNGNKIYVAKPTTYMNLSGNFVQSFIHYYKIKIENILVIYDDVSMEVGKFKLKNKGSSGGQNGIKNIINMLNTENIKRLKIGISNIELIKKTPLKDFVLFKFNNEELKKIENLYPVFRSIIQDFVNIDFEKIMSKYNKK